jgi:hypothetical protein
VTLTQAALGVPGVARACSTDASPLSASVEHSWCLGCGQKESRTSVVSCDARVTPRAADGGALKPDFRPLEHRLRGLYLGLWKSSEAGRAKAKSADVQKLRDDVDTPITALPELAKEAAERMGDVGAAPAPARVGADNGGGPTVVRRARGGGIFKRIRISLDGLDGFGPLQVELPNLRSLLRRAWDAVNARVDENLGWDALGILVVGLAIAVGSGLSTEYAGKVIGGPWDYMKLFLWGFATNLLVSTSAKGLDAIGVVRAARQ